jgi:hypothetical protein
MTNWKKEFEHKFGAFALIGSAGRFYNGAFANEARVRDAISFIQELLNKQREELKELLKIEKVGLPTTKKQEQRNYEKKIINQFKTDLLKKLEEK